MNRPPKLDSQLDSLAPLGEPVRRALYLYVVRQPGDVSRDDAAKALKVSRDLAAFHLDKLVSAGLLKPVFRRVTGRSGPGAGRPAKLYRRAPGQIEISLPQREYQLASRIFLRALGLTDHKAADEAVNRAARELGFEIGSQANANAGPRASEERRESGLLELLESWGYQPLRVDESVRLRNCPFHVLAQEFQHPVCDMNLAFLEGMRAGAGVEHMRPELTRVEGYCCVSFGLPNVA